MSLRWNSLITLIAFAAICAGSGSSQQGSPEKHVAQIKAEQTPEAIAASPFCQWAQKEVDKGGPMALAIDKKPILYKELRYSHDSDFPDLKSLFDASDEVVLAIRGPFTGAVAPSGGSAITYHDAQVLRSWKGEYKAGEVLTFAIPVGKVNCPSAHAYTFDPLYDWNSIGLTLNILFLRHSNAQESEITPGLRLTGGYGQQGMIGVFLIKGLTPEPWACITPAVFTKTVQQDIGKCTAYLDHCTDPILFQSPHDPIAALYDRTPVSTFLGEIQSLADSGSSSPNERR